jgi:hypothetical protein
MHAAKRVPGHDIFIPNIRPPLYRFTLPFRGCASLSSVSAGFDPGRYTLAASRLHRMLASCDELGVAVACDPEGVGGEFGAVGVEGRGFCED